MSVYQLSTLDREAWIARKLVIAYTGVTTPRERCEVVRRELLSRGIADTLAYKTKTSGSKSWRQVFKMTYGEELEQPSLWA